MIARSLLCCGNLGRVPGESSVVSAARTSPFVAATRRCGACRYDLKGLPLKGKCPECGAAYDRPVQAEELAGASRHCRACWYDLSGLPGRGRCPECGVGYDRVEQIVEKRRADRRAMNGNQMSADLLRRWAPSAWTVAVLLLIVGGAAIMLAVGAVAVKKFARVVDPPQGCSGGGGGLPF